MAIIALGLWTKKQYVWGHHQTYLIRTPEWLRSEAMVVPMQYQNQWNMDYLILYIYILMFMWNQHTYFDAVFIYYPLIFPWYPTFLVPFSWVRPSFFASKATVNHLQIYGFQPSIHMGALWHCFTNLSSRFLLVKPSYYQIIIMD